MNFDWSDLLFAIVIVVAIYGCVECHKVDTNYKIEKMRIEQTIKKDTTNETNF